MMVFHIYIGKSFIKVSYRAYQENRKSPNLIIEVTPIRTGRNRLKLDQFI